MPLDIAYFDISKSTSKSIITTQNGPILIKFLTRRVKK